MTLRARAEPQEGEQAGDQGQRSPAFDVRSRDRQAPAQVVWVAGSGGDFTSLSAALGSITDASVSKPYVVRIAPGEYVETSTVALKSYVDVEGSGEGVTTITCACGSDVNNETAATVSAGDIAAEIRHVTIENTGGDEFSTGVYTELSSASVSMLHVTATATGAGPYYYGVYNYYSSPTMTDVTATATGGGTNYGVLNYRSWLSIRNSSITGTSNSIRNVDSYAFVADTRLVGSVFGAGFTCVGAHSGPTGAVFSLLGPTCT